MIYFYIWKVEDRASSKWKLILSESQWSLEVLDNGNWSHTDVHSNQHVGTAYVYGKRWLLPRIITEMRINNFKKMLELQYRTRKKVENHSVNISRPGIVLLISDISLWEYRWFKQSQLLTVHAIVSDLAHYSTDLSVTAQRHDCAESRLER